MLRIMLVGLLFVFGALAVGIYFYWIEPSDGKREKPDPKPALSGMPVEWKVDQRSSTAVPGSEGALLLTIGDITDDQAMVSLASAEGVTVAASQSMSEGDDRVFRYRDQMLRLSLLVLDSSLLGTDRAQFRIEATVGSQLSEKQKIERLIASIESLEGAVFVRNGESHTAQKAADHLRMKWKRAGKRVRTAEDFIVGLATESSMSGKPYLIRFAGGETTPSGEYLRKKLQEIEAS